MIARSIARSPSARGTVGEPPFAWNSSVTQCVTVSVIIDAMP